MPMFKYKKEKSMKKSIFSSIIFAFASLSPAYGEIENNDAEMIIKGGQIYDSYYTVTGADKPETNSPSYANKAGKYGGEASWRCKECHGWGLYRQRRPLL